MEKYPPAQMLQQRHKTNSEAAYTSCPVHTEKLRLPAPLARARIQGRGGETGDKVGGAGVCCLAERKVRQSH